jgi:hypothetical protein
MINSYKNQPSRRPGTELQLLFKSIGLFPHPGCRCLQTMKQMDEWGPGGCTAHLGQIVHTLEDDAERYQWRELIKATYLAVYQMHTFIDPLNAIESFVLEAIRLSENPLPVE